MMRICDCKDGLYVDAVHTHQPYSYLAVKGYKAYWFDIHKDCTGTTDHWWNKNNRTDNVRPFTLIEQKLLRAEIASKKR